MLMPDLPAELQMFGALLDGQPTPVREAFQYCLCLMMQESGKMELVDTIPGDAQVLYHFKTVDDEVFTVPHPGITPEQEATVMDLLREILADEGEI